MSIPSEMGVPRAIKTAIVARIKQGALYELVERYGSQRAAAQALGISAHRFSQWINFANLPGRNGKIRKNTHLAQTLSAQGFLLEDVFPERGISLERGQTERIYQMEIPEDRLVRLDDVRQIAIPSHAVTIESRNFIEQCLRALRPRERDVIAKNFGVCGESEHNVTEISKCWSLSKQRVSQIRKTALRKLRRIGRTWKKNPDRLEKRLEHETLFSQGMR